MYDIILFTPSAFSLLGLAVLLCECGTDWSIMLAYQTLELNQCNI
jgi:hypothetical protein